MSHKKQLGLIILVLAILTGIGYYIGDPVNNGLCILHDTVCGNYYAQTLGGPIFFFSASILLSAILLLFSSEQTYKKWRKFALWAIPIGIIILYLAPADGGSSMATGKDLSKETASWGVSFFFLITSIILITRSQLQSKRQ